MELSQTLLLSCWLIASFPRCWKICIFFIPSNGPGKSRRRSSSAIMPLGLLKKHGLRNAAGLIGIRENAGEKKQMQHFFIMFHLFFAGQKNTLHLWVLVPQSTPLSSISSQVHFNLRVLEPHKTISNPSDTCLVGTHVSYSLQSWTMTWTMSHVWISLSFWDL